MPTVYVHVRSQRERDRLQTLARTLAAHGIRVVDVKVINKGPNVADLRYFRDEDKDTALTVQKAMVSAGVPVPRLSRMNGFEGSTRPGHFEAWLGGDRLPEPARSALAGDLAEESEAFEAPDQLVGRREGHADARGDEGDVDDW